MADMTNPVVALISTSSQAGSSGFDAIAAHIIVALRPLPHPPHRGFVATTR
jgi:hypothetical protein